MQTKTYNTYKFDELTDKQKEKAIYNLRDINVDSDFWHECVIEDRTAKLIDYGFEGVKIYFSGFFSQGDGTCFIATLDNEGLLKFLTKEKTLSKYPTLVKALKTPTIYVNIKITHSDRYYHAYSTSIEDYTEMQDNSELESKLLQEYTEWNKTFFDRDARNGRIGWYIDECEDIYKHLRTEYEYQTEDYAIIETIQANDYDFTEDGKLD